MGARVTAWYELHTLKVQCHYASLNKLYHGTCTLFFHHCIQKMTLAIFAVRPIHFVCVEFVFAPTAPCIVHLLITLPFSELYK